MALSQQPAAGGAGKLTHQPGDRHNGSLSGDTVVILFVWLLAVGGLLEDSTHNRPYRWGNLRGSRVGR